MLTSGEIEHALGLWSQTASGRAQLINHSENLTFRVETPSGGRYILRVHRHAYQSQASIRSELGWLAALRRDTTLRVPQPITGHDGKLIQHVSTSAGPQFAVLFHHIPGHEPEVDDASVPLFETLGQHAATLHHHSQSWPQPAAFERPVLNAEALLGGPWGDWHSAPGLTTDTLPILSHLADTLACRLHSYGTAPDRFGLIHADMRLGNLLVDGEHLAILDFDDCGYGWFIYDFAAAISFHETHTSIPALKAAWLRGYRKVRPLNAEDEAIMDTMVMLRRLALLAWIGSHRETSLAQRFAPRFAEDTATLARHYLKSDR